VVRGGEEKKMRKKNYLKDSATEKKTRDPTVELKKKGAVPSVFAFQGDRFAIFFLSIGRFGRIGSFLVFFFIAFSTFAVIFCVAQGSSSPSTHTHKDTAATHKQKRFT